MTGPASEIRLTCRPEQADELIARARAAFPMVGEPRGPYPNRPGRRRDRRGGADVDVDQDVAAGMVRIYLDLDYASGDSLATAPGLTPVDVGLALPDLEARDG